MGTGDAARADASRRSGESLSRGEDGPAGRGGPSVGEGSLAKAEKSPPSATIGHPAPVVPFPGRTSRKDRGNVFVARSRFQILIAGHMVRSMPEFARADNCLVLDMPRQEACSGDAPWKEIVFLEPSAGGPLLDRARRRRKSLEAVAAILSRYRFARLFLSDIQWPLNNALFGHARRRKGKAVELCHFPDGLASLLPVYPGVLKSLGNLLRALVGAVGGPPFHYYEGDLAGLSLSDRVYSLMPAGTGSGGKRVVAIPRIRPLLLNRNPYGCLFLGQDVERVMPEKAYRDLCAGAARFTINLGYRDLSYKPHPRETSGIGEEVFKRHGFEILRDPRPVEEIFFTRQTACVASFDNDSLAHLKLMFGDDVRCVACFIRETARYAGLDGRAERRLIDLLLLCGVEPYA